MTGPPLTTGVLFSSLLQYDCECEAKEMEGKNRAAAIAALCMLLLLAQPKPSHQQPSGVNCMCYQHCYPGCKDRISPLFCKVKCAGRCPDAIDGLASCLIACDMDSICDQPGPSVDVEVCRNVCHDMWVAGGAN
ncbi:uncharacterized protein [Triticum aestivum]|uniref:uncharacterized protein n=1 Tax=Triticum aestivum TaxID=4565 RepID=UPI001D006505|nr:uncharacterized protein LOC123133438 [Triticum aestivum]XP_044408864.1 uncharacterized protein LOC123133441 [Triticum aestivum]XP_044446195.1 uncharacterized protein LOC123175662 [Triticum aestivum]XP_044446618.1 uncharacterized protein LOC123176509 [Triticum aestivum]